MAMYLLKKCETRYLRCPTFTIFFVLKSLFLDELDFDRSLIDYRYRSLNRLTILYSPGQKTGTIDWS